MWKRIWDCKIENGGIEAVADYFVEFIKSLPYDHSRYLEASLIAIKALIEANLIEKASNHMKNLNLLLDQKKVIFNLISIF